MALILKKNQETEIPKKIPHISGNGNPKKAVYIPGNGTFHPKLEKTREIHPEKIFLIFQEIDLSNY